MKENKVLRAQAEDLKITLKINKDFLFKYISENRMGSGALADANNQSENSKLLKELESENHRLNENINNLFKETLSSILVYGTEGNKMSD